jgi:hypothetical protein
MGDPNMLIDEIFPEYDECEYHEIEIKGQLNEVYRAIRSHDFSDSFLIRYLFRLRGLPGRLKSIDDLLDLGFVLVAEVPDEEIVLGLVGRFWDLTAKIEKVDGSQYHAFNLKGYAKLAWNFQVREIDPGVVRLSTETRVRCIDQHSRRRFKLYWFFVGPFSGLVRIELLRRIKRIVESA